MPKRILRKIQNNRSWQIASAILLVIAVGAGTLGVYEAHHHPTIVRAAAITNAPLKLSSVSQAELDSIRNINSTVVAVAAVDVDLVKNSRHTTYFKSFDPGMQQVWDDYMTHRVNSVPTFASQPENNDRVTSIINGSFVCTRFTETLNYQFYPAADKYAPYLCTIAVPSGSDKSGDFVGFLNFFMAHNPSDDERKHLADRASQISSDIYQRDILGKKSK